jgi:hypothetical protein
MAIREGKWRCTYCSSVNRGAELACSGCGATREKDVTFFLEDEAPEVTDAALLKTARAGADWLCQFCQTSNRPDAGHCVQCGAEKGSAPSREVRDVPQAPPPPAEARPAAAPRRRSSGCGFVLALVGLLFLGFCGWGVWRSLRKTEEAVRVSAHEWSRAVKIEALRTVRESAWEGELPPGARVVARTRAVHHTEQVQTGTQRVKVGTRDLGNGFFEDVYEERPVYRSRDVYAQRLTYEVERWTLAKNLEARGGDRRPRWPDVRLARGEREAGREQRYTVVLRGRREYRLDLPEQRWAALEPGQELRAVIQGGSRVVELR